MTTAELIMNRIQVSKKIGRGKSSKENTILLMSYFCLSGLAEKSPIN